MFRLTCLIPFGLILYASQADDALLRQGLDLAAREDFAGAAEVFERCLKINPSSFEAGYNLALARLALKEPQQALGALNSVTAQSVKQQALHDYLGGKILAEAGHANEGIQRMAASFRTDPSNENCALDLGLAYIRAQAYVSAVDVLTKVVNLQGGSDLVVLELALAEALAGQNDEAITHSRRLLARGGDSLPRLIQVFALNSKGNYAESVQTATNALSRLHPNPYLHYLRADAKWKSQTTDPVEILDDLDQAVQALPECTVCLLLREKVNEKLGKDSAAIADLEHATQIDPKLGQAWYRLSVLYRKQGKLPEAAGALNKSKALRDDEAQHDREYFSGQAVGVLGSEN